jgi:hypothetical protein
MAAVFVMTTLRARRICPNFLGGLAGKSSARLPR